MAATTAISDLMLLDSMDAWLFSDLMLWDRMYAWRKCTPDASLHLVTFLRLRHGRVLVVGEFWSVSQSTAYCLQLKGFSFEHVSLEFRSLVGNAVFF